MALDDAATAHHEAGHAVAALTYRRSLTRVSIEADGHSLGRVDHRPQRVVVPVRGEVSASVRRAVNADIVVAWAGPLAEERVVGSYDHVTAEHDLDRMFDQAMVVTLDHAQEALAYVEWLRWRTVRLLREPGIWPQVEAVAAALLEERTLSGPAVARIMETTARRQRRPAPPSMA
jgi:ATP-dependent Zn protease